jgi:hypothetical protein
MEVVDDHSNHTSGASLKAGVSPKSGESTVTRHSTAVGTFSVIAEGQHIEPLAFARWIRQLATLKPEHGVLYRLVQLLEISSNCTFYARQYRV